MGSVVGFHLIVSAVYEASLPNIGNPMPKKKKGGAVFLRGFRIYKRPVDLDRGSI